MPLSLVAGRPGVPLFIAIGSGAYATVFELSRPWLPGRRAHLRASARHLHNWRRSGGAQDGVDTCKPKWPRI